MATLIEVEQVRDGTKTRYAINLDRVDYVESTSNGSLIVNFRAMDGTRDQDGSYKIFEGVSYVGFLGAAIRADVPCKTVAD